MVGLVKGETEEAEATLGVYAADLPPLLLLVLFFFFQKTSFVDFF